MEAAGIRLPGSLPGRDGRLVVPLPEELGGGWLRLYRWIDGVPTVLADLGLAVRVGDLLGRLHAHGLPPQGEADPGTTRFPVRGPGSSSLTPRLRKESGGAPGKHHQTAQQIAREQVDD